MSATSNTATQDRTVSVDAIRRKLWEQLEQDPELLIEDDTPEDLDDDDWEQWADDQIDAIKRILAWPSPAVDEVLLKCCDRALARMTELDHPAYVGEWALLQCTGYEFAAAYFRGEFDGMDKEGAHGPH